MKHGHPGRMEIGAGAGLSPAPGQCCLDSCSAVAVVLGTVLPALGQKTKPRCGSGTGLVRRGTCECLVGRCEEMFQRRNRHVSWQCSAPSPTCLGPGLGVRRGAWDTAPRTARQPGAEGIHSCVATMPGPEPPAFLRNVTVVGRGVPCRGHESAPCQTTTPRAPTAVASAIVDTSRVV